MMSRGRAFGAVPLRIALLAVALCLVLSGCGSGGRARPADGVAGAVSPRVWRPGSADSLGPVVAVVGARRIRAREVDSIIATAPPNVQPQLREKEGYKNLVERMITEEAVYQTARRSGIERDPAYQGAVARAARDILMRTYYDRRIAGMPPPSDSAVAAYYQAHAAEYEIPARVRVRHIQVATRAKAQALRKRLASGGLWDALARESSTDKLTKDQGGVVGFVTPASDQVPGVGKAPSIVAAAFQLKEGETSQPLKSERAWHLIRVDNIEPKRTQSLEEVRRRIVDQLRGQGENEFSKALIDSLRAASGAVIFDDSIAVATAPAQTPQEYFKMAQTAVNPERRIELYRDVVQRFPNDPISIQAAFMIGFTYAEDMGEYDKARVEFQKFLATHPNAELANSARWMLENMDKPAPDLRDAPEGMGGKGAPSDSTR